MASNGPVVHRVFANRAEWLAARRFGIGASEVSAVLGLNPYRSCFEVWAQKVTGSTDNAADESEAAQWGTLLEPLVMSEVSRRIGRPIYAAAGTPGARNLVSFFNTDLLAKGVPLFVTPDGQIAPTLRQDTASNEAGDSAARCNKINTLGDRCQRTASHPEWEGYESRGHVYAAQDPRGPGLYEGKASGLFVAREEWATEGPQMHLIQVQAGLAVLGWKWGLLAGLIGGQKLVPHVQERDDEFIAWMLAELAKFWELVVSQTPPTPDDSAATAKALSAYYSRGVPGLTKELPAAARVWAKERRDAKEQAKEAEARITAVENQIKGAMGEASIGYVPAPEQWDTSQGPRPEVEGFYWPSIQVKETLCEHCDAPVRRASEHRRMSELPKKIKGLL